MLSDPPRTADSGLVAANPLEPDPGLDAYGAELLQRVAGTVAIMLYEMELRAAYPRERKAATSSSFDISERPVISASCARAYSSSFVRSSSARGRGFLLP